MAIVSTGQITITDVNDAVSARLSNEFCGVPTNTDGTGGDFTGCSTTITVNQGMQDITANGWSITASPSAGVSGTLVGQTYTVTGLSVDSGYVDLVATHSNGDTLSKRFTITKVKKGEAGALITLVPTSQGFFFKDGLPEPTSQMIGFMVIRQNTDAKVVFEASDGVPLLTDEGYLDAAQYADGIYGQGQGDMCYLSVADFGNRKQVTVTAKAGSLASSVTILRLDESSAEPGATRNVFRGALSYGQAYLVGDTVISDGYGWSCIQAHFSEEANRPPPYPATENTWWALASVKGADTLNAVLSNEAFVFPAGNDGAVSSYTGSGTAVRVYEGAEELLYDGVGTSSGTWKVATSATNITVGSLTDSGTYLTVGQHSGVANGTDTASITYTITGKTKAGVAFTLMKVQTFAKGKAGATGATGRYGLNFAEAKSMFTDPTFQIGSNGIGIYNNAGGGTVTHTREAKQTDSPFTDSGFNMKISNTGAASPGIGGFIHSFNGRASAVFVQRIVAKIPVGYTIEQATNAIGDGATNEWITPQAGTGKFAEYILVRRCGATGTFSGSGHIYLNGAAGSAGAPVNWYVAYAATYDFTSVGFGAVTAVLSNETHTVPTDSAGNNGSFTGCATTVTIYNGTTDDSANWTVAATPLEGVTGSLAGKTYTVTAMTVDTGYVDLVASRSGYASVTKRFTLTKSKAGATGAQGPSVVVTPNRALAFTATNGTLDAAQADIVFTAAVSGVSSPTYVWSFSGFESAPTNSGTATQTITAAHFGNAKNATVTCTVSGTYKDVATIVRLEVNTSDAAKANGALQKAGDAITGPVTFASNGGILAATDADNGVFMGPNGLVGKKAGATTFAIDTAGNASFGGALSAATGSFSGTLDGVSGTFSGTLTADAINAVNTINVAGNAITLPIGAAGVSGSLGSGVSSATVLTSEVTLTENYGIFVAAQCSVEVTQNKPNASVYSVFGTVAIYRNGALLDSQKSDTVSMSSSESGSKSAIVNAAFIRFDSPGTGTHTYTVSVSRSSTTLTNCSYEPPQLFLMVTKR